MSKKIITIFVQSHGCFNFGNVEQRCKQSI